MQRFQSAVLILLVLLMPLRGMAAATMALLPADSHGEAIHMEAGCHHEDAKQSSPDTNHNCNTCAEHGCCGAFLTSIANDVLPAFITAARITLGQRLIAGFVPEHLDPPPLAL